MSVVCYEMKDSMSGSVSNVLEQGEQRKVKRRYVLGQLEGFNAVVSEMELYAPQYVVDGGGYYWVRRMLTVDSVGNKYFDCAAEYETLLPKNSDSGGTPGQPQAGSLAWDTTGNTERVYQALSQTRYPETAPDFQEAIGVNGSSVEGVDKVVAGMRYSETWIFPAQAAFNGDYMGAVHRLTGTVNSEQFRAFEPGEALFVGARCQWQGDQPFCSITFEFECRPNTASFYIKALAAFAKKGWEYVWVRYEDDVDGGRLIRRPVAAYVNRIYREQSWAPLLITVSQVGQPVTPRLGRAPSKTRPFGS